ncbi:hypothetical protein F5X98DRAFT_330487 [Xylaria grammica]|nr:hypothetical protein F5X98DRAFT_330487 [Xylaria grammica]
MTSNFVLHGIIYGLHMYVCMYVCLYVCTYVPRLGTFSFLFLLRQVHACITSVLSPGCHPPCLCVSGLNSVLVAFNARLRRGKNLRHKSRFSIHSTAIEVAAAAAAAAASSSYLCIVYRY